MRRLSVLLIAVIAAMAMAIGPAGAISGGDLDGNDHPNVAMIVFYQPDGRFRCSATLVSPTVLVTAAHCTEGVRGKTIVTLLCDGGGKYQSRLFNPEWLAERGLHPS